MKQLPISLIPSKLRRKTDLWLSKITTKLNGRFVEGFLVNCVGHKFLVAVDDMFVCRELRQSGSYGRDELKLIDRLVTEKSSVVFVGAHIGALSIPTAKKVESAVFVEANPQTYKFLFANMLINELTNTVSHCIAVGEEKGEINFLLSTVNSGGSKREPLIKDKMYYFDEPQIISVPMVTLDSLLSDSTRKYDLVFMDIEGSEYFALKGMTKTLQRTKSLVVEFIPHHLRNVANVSVAEFLETIEVFFDYCFVPSHKKYLTKTEFLGWFGGMHERDESDAGLIFTTEYVDFS